MADNQTRGVTVCVTWWIRRPLKLTPLDRVRYSPDMHQWYSQICPNNQLGDLVMHTNRKMTYQLRS